MNEMLKKRIDEKFKTFEEIPAATWRAGNCEIASTILEFAKEIFTIGAEFALKSQWISVDEALPEEDPDCHKWLLVLVRTNTEDGSTKDILQLGLYCGNGRFSCETRNIKAVAWMPVPEMEG